MSATPIARTTLRALPVRASPLVSRRFLSVKNAEAGNNLNPPEGENGIPNPDAPGWKEDLASTSEAFVKADRSHAHASSPSSTSELQEQTIEFVARRYSPEDRTSSTTAGYVRDEVSGPLKSAAGQEDDEGSFEPVKAAKKVAEKVVEKVEETVKGA